MAKTQTVKAKLTILRHGQTEYNKKKWMTGRADIPLTVMGIEQAKHAGKLLQGHVFDVVYASTLQRAFNTAALAIEHSKTNPHFKKDDGTWHVIKVSDLDETDAGDWTGRCHKTDSEILNHKRDFYKPRPNGESDHQVVERVTRFFQNEVLPRLEKGENVLVVCHAGIVRAFDHVLGLEAVPERGAPHGSKRRIANATPTIFEYEDGKMTGYYETVNAKEVEASAKARKEYQQSKAKNDNQKKPPKFGT